MFFTLFIQLTLFNTDEIYSRNYNINNIRQTIVLMYWIPARLSFTCRQEAAGRASILLEANTNVPVSIKPCFPWGEVPPIHSLFHFCSTSLADLVWIVVNMDKLNGANTIKTLDIHIILINHLRHLRNHTGTPSQPPTMP